jgi:hypothetical protein
MREMSVKIRFAIDGIKERTLAAISYLGWLVRIDPFYVSDVGSRVLHAVGGACDGLFLDFLTENYGIERLQKYPKKHINNPDGYRRPCDEIYSSEFDELVDRYRSQLNE